MKSILKIIIPVILIFMLVCGGGIFFLTRGLDEGIQIKINEIRISDINDGIYYGKYNAGRWANQISVTVKENKITEIKVIDDVTFVKPGISDELFSKVIEVQNTKVDAISQATVTSKAYLKSIENALNNKNKCEVTK